jgi:predicted transcriptional regulator
MIERGFLDVKTFKDIISSRSGKQKLVTIEPSQTVADAVEMMKKYDIENIPVMNGNWADRSYQREWTVSKNIFQPRYKKFES